MLKGCNITILQISPLEHTMYLISPQNQRNSPLVDLIASTLLQEYEVLFLRQKKLKLNYLFPHLMAESAVYTIIYLAIPPSHLRPQFLKSVICRSCGFTKSTQMCILFSEKKRLKFSELFFIRRGRKDTLPHPWAKHEFLTRQVTHAAWI